MRDSMAGQYIEQRTINTHFTAVFRNRLTAFYKTISISPEGDQCHFWTPNDRQC
jgi:hypothetical protein